jgi:hypothetical protein
MKTTSVPTKNYKLDTSPDQVKWQKSVNERLKENRRGGNSSVIAGDSFSEPLKIPEGVNYGLGYVVQPSLTSNFYPTVFLPSFYKENNVKSYTLGAGINNINNYGQGFGLPEVDYLVPVYLNIFRFLNNQELTIYGSLLDPFIIYPLGNIAWTNATGFTWENNINPTTSFDLEDFMLTRNYDATLDLLDFSNTNSTNSNNKITSLQYTKILTENSTFGIGLCYDGTGLTMDQKTRFDGIFNVAGANTLPLNLTISFKMFGLMASYQPINA